MARECECLSRRCGWYTDLFFVDEKILMSAMIVAPEMTAAAIGPDGPHWPSTAGLAAPRCRVRMSIGAIHSTILAQEAQETAQISVFRSKKSIGVCPIKGLRLELFLTEDPKPQ